MYGYNIYETDSNWGAGVDDCYIANVTYLYNYDDSPNSGYYWVDTYGESIITFIPPEPTREGYIFEGWYKESECINAWDFDVDVTGEELQAKGYKSEIYEGIYLYAKWRTV